MVRYACALAVVCVFSWACSSGSVEAVIQDVGEIVPMPDVNEPDVGSEDTAKIPDLVVPDQFVLPELMPELPPHEVEPQCVPGEGCFMDPCTENDDCDSGWCVQHAGEGICTIPCETECPLDFSCKKVGGSDPDVVYMCVSNVANLCLPCSAGADCANLDGTQDGCVVYPGEGSFCGAPCAESGECPAGYSCQQATTVDGIELEQCVSDEGVCHCSSGAVAQGLFTPCEVENQWGVCTGKRVCTEDGLGQCDAETPAEEVCNGVDDDCDGDVDEPDQVSGDYVNLCHDDNECTDDVCSGEGGCDNPPLSGTDCSDGDLCTESDHCEEGACVASPIICDDDNLCTDDSCGEDGECVFAPNMADCDDGDPCTVADECTAGECAGTPVNCDCQIDEDCAELEDGDLCNGTLFCDTSQLPYSCAVVEDSVVECPGPAGVDAPCWLPVCDPETGVCDFEPAFDGYACDDGDACTMGDTCQEGVCGGGVPTNCADDNPCTDDSCDTATGCVHTPNSEACNDGDACTLDDACADSQCVGGEPLVCDDGNVCTADSCDPAVGCVTAPVDGDCDDGNLCTENDSCVAGACVGGQALDCDDGNLCTNDSCTLESGCVNTPNQAPCDDEDACTTGDTCGDGSCQPGVPVVCDDDNVCTEDTCDTQAGCQFAAADGNCDDLNACTDGDYCKEGKCFPGDLVDCSDDNLCTDDKCHVETGCYWEHNDAPCDDGNHCLNGDVCAAGVCAGTVDLECNDSNVCTDDSCDPDTGCVFTNNQALCDDLDACTDVDQCADGACVPGEAVVCVDDNPCTQDLCDHEDGCTFLVLPDGTPCLAEGVCEGQCDVAVCADVAVEVCDGLDNTCDELVDEGFADFDEDGEADCVDEDDDNDLTPDGADCQPLNPDVHPGATEQCGNDVDDDCDIETPDQCILEGCQAYIDEDASVGDGLYWVDPDGDNGPGEPFQVYCDMTTAGGGWTLCMNSVASSKTPSTDIVAHLGDAGWDSGHARDCTYLGIDTKAQIRHLIVDTDRDRIVNGYYTGTFHGTLPLLPAWTALGADEARVGEEHTGFDGDCGFEYHFGKSWGCTGNCCNLYGPQWYYGGCYNYIPLQAGQYCTTGPSDGCGGGAPSCVERYSIFVRPAVPGPGDVPELAGTHCKEIKDLVPGAADGVFWIDPDGDGGEAPFQAYCDMTIDGGGWTRFNWVLQSTYPAGEDPLGEALSDCDPTQTLCRGRIPTSTNPTSLLVVDKTDNKHAAWNFDNGTISNAVLGALRDKVQYCGQQQGAFQPYLSTSAEGYCGNGQEGGCDSFYYTSGSCLNAGNWGVHWDGDGHWCAAVFKLGATVAGGCGQGDHAFLNDCDCNDEQGELYYR